MVANDNLFGISKPKRDMSHNAINIVIPIYTHNKI